MSNLIIKKAILHILDTNIEVPVLSDTEIELTDEIQEFLIHHIEKMMDDSDLKKCSFYDNSSIKDTVERLNIDNFIDVSKQMGQKLFNIMFTNVNIPASDIVYCLFEDGINKFLGIMKFNYRVSYIHNLSMSEGKKQTGIVKQKTSIASETQKIDECIFINLKDNSILLKEKKYEVNGEKINYLSELYLKAKSNLSPKQQYNIINNTTKKVVEEFYNDDVIKHAEVKTYIEKNIDDNMEIDVNKVADQFFENNIELKNQYKEELVKRGIDNGKIRVNEQIKKRIISNEKIITEEGIELRIPAKYLADNQKVEFIMNQDGTISIMIKSIKNMNKR